MLRGGTKVFDQKAYDFSMEQALAMMNALR